MNLLIKLKQTHRPRGNRLKFTWGQEEAVGRMEGGIFRELGMDSYTLLYFKRTCCKA